MPLPPLRKTIKTSEPILEVTADRLRPLKAGRYRIQLVVVSSSGRESEPVFHDIVVRTILGAAAETEKPTRRRRQS